MPGFANDSQLAGKGMSVQPYDKQFDAGNDPMAVFAQWYEAARTAEPTLPDAVAVATAGADGLPNVRMVLLKGFSEAGFVFYTNTHSIKGDELRDNPNAALCFYWKSIQRQVRVRGPVEPVSAAEADAYFATRAKDSQIGAWASDQSKPLKGRFDLEARVAQYAAKYALAKVDRPPYWSGYRVKPLSIEFWRERRFRLHDRKIFRRQSVDCTEWEVQALYP